MHDKVFPEHAVKQALAELDIDRSDDGILSVVQCDLTTLCLTTVLRGAMVSCLLRKRKFLNDADVSYALCSCTLPVSSRSSRDVGFLLDSRYFGALCAQHCKLLAKVLEPEFAMMKQVAEVKISAETQVLVQRAVERVVRGVLEQFASEAHGGPHGFRELDRCLRSLTGEPEKAAGTFVTVEGTL